MEYVIYIFKIILYVFNILIMYKCIKTNKKINKFSFSSIIIISLIMGIYGIICGDLSDRRRYGLFFSNSIYDYIIRNDSIGLYYIYKFLHLFTYNKYFLFFIIPFIYFFITLTIYNKMEEVYPLCILLLGLSNYSTFGYIAFKQCIAVALISLSWSYYLKKDTLKCIISMLLAIAFHETALIVIPIYLCLSFISKSGIMRLITYIILALSVFFFKDICMILYKVLNLIPGMSIQMSGYFNNSGELQTSMNYLTIIKGAPFFIITFYAFIKKKALKDKIKNYNKHLILCVFCSISWLLSMHMYWMWRLGMYCYYPIFIFFSQIMHYQNNGQEKRVLIFIEVLLLLFILVRYLIQCYFIYGGIY